MKNLFLVIFTLLPVISWAQEDLKTQNVFLITFDGLRWQEVFTGADATLIGDEAYVTEPENLKTRFWHDEPLQRRAKLMPFFWSVIAEEGQLFGNRNAGSKVNVTNNHWFSYPGYNEILVGYADDRIDSNDKKFNTNTTVLEFVNRQPEFRQAVAAFGSWDVFPFIINEPRSGIPVNAGFEAATGQNLSNNERFLNTLQQEVPSPWSTVRLDAFTHHYAMEYIKKHSPRLVFIAYGETDDFAHDGKFDAYLTSAHQTDAFIRDLWHWVQSHEPYRNKTTFIITTDHGRGTVPKDTWRSHGTDIEGSDQIWFAVIGPDTHAGGEIKSAGQYFQNQMAKTTARFLGVEYINDKEVGRAITEVIGK